MHRHFRILAISEHLRNHGFDPDLCPHTRIPGIWAKLAEFYDLAAVDEREISLDPPEEQGKPRRYKDFSLPHEYLPLMLERAQADPSEAPTSPAQWDPEAPRDRDATLAADGRKRKRGTSETTSKNRSSTVEDTEGEVSAPSPARRPARGRGARRAASRTRKAKEETKHESSEEEEDESGEEGSGSEDEEEEEEEANASTSKSSRGGRGRGSGRGRSRGRARGRGRG